MKTNKLLCLVALASALSIVTTHAQSVTWWRIVNGPGAGVLLMGTDVVIQSNANPGFGAEGFIAVGHFTDCECTAFDGHYHGTLFGKPDPKPDNCGWGCVVKVPCTLSEASIDLGDAIDDTTGTNSALADKLYGLLGTADGAVRNDCPSLFRGAMNAFGEELLGALANGALTLDEVDEIVKALIEYVDLGYDAMGLSFPPTPPPPKPCKVNLLMRRGSAAQTKLFDAKRKIIADVGEVVVLDAQGCPGDGPYEWEYKFKGGALGDVPSGAGISFTPQRFCVLSEKPTTVKVTVIYHCPDGKTVKDTATIVIQ
jgi:hypothetical protein